VRDATAEQRIARGLRFVHVRVELISRQVRKTLDVRDRDLAFRGVEGIADRKLREGLRNGCVPGSSSRAPFTQRPVTAVMASGVPCTAARCM